MDYKENNQIKHYTSFITYIYSYSTVCIVDSFEMFHLFIFVIVTIAFICTTGGKWIIIKRMIYSIEVFCQNSMDVIMLIKSVNQWIVKKNSKTVPMVIKNKMVVKYVNAMIHVTHLEKYNSFSSQLLRNWISY